MITNGPAKIRMLNADPELTVTPGIAGDIGIFMGDVWICQGGTTWTKIS